jgi:hypothetical protein
MRWIGVMAAVMLMAGCGQAWGGVIYSLTGLVGQSPEWSSSGPGEWNFSLYYADVDYPFPYVPPGHYVLTFKSPAPVLATGTVGEVYVDELEVDPDGGYTGFDYWYDASTGFLGSASTTKIIGKTVVTTLTVPPSFQFSYPYYRGGRVQGYYDFVGAFDVDVTVDGGYGAPFSLTLSAVPEPAAWALLLTGFGLGGAVVRRRRKAPGVSAACSVVC